MAYLHITKISYCRYDVQVLKSDAVHITVLPLSSIKKSFSLSDFCKYFLVKVAKFPGEFPSKL